MTTFSRIMRLSLAIICAISSTTMSSQLEIETSSETDALVQEFLLGSGVVIDNITYNGDVLQIGSFDGAEDIVGMDSGLIMCTDGVEGSENGEDVSVWDGIVGDDDLFNLANSVPPLIGQDFTIFEVYDVASLEFDFVPLGDSLAFDFVFGSDEYMAFVNSGFNDVFGFFISGPGISGPYQSPAGFEGGAINIAVVPGTDPELPITVSSVNAFLNADYYNDNPENEEIYINGYTDVITASASGLTVGETYHMRLAIADGSDSVAKSIVMLQAGSFSSYATVEPGAPGDFDGDGDLDVDDLLVIIGAVGCTGTDCIGDLNADGIVNVFDVLDFLGLF